MSGAPDDTAHDGLLDKWRGRWPEWRIAQVFVPEPQRATAEVWFALLQEWTDAAWTGADPTPGFAKLAWWQEELRGWAKGLRRHPLGRDLHRRPVPWAALADALPALQAVREPLAADMHDPAALAALKPLIEAAAGSEAALFGGRADSGDVFPWLAAHALWPRDDAQAAARAWACALPAPVPAGTRPRRVYDTLAHARLRCFGAIGVPLPLSPLPTLWRSWRAARG